MRFMNPLGGEKVDENLNNITGPNQDNSSTGNDLSGIDNVNNKISMNNPTTRLGGDDVNINATETDTAAAYTIASGTTDSGNVRTEAENSDTRNLRADAEHGDTRNYRMDEGGNIRADRGGAAASSIGANMAFVVIGWICAALTLLWSPFFAIAGIVFGVLANSQLRGSGNTLIVTNVVFAVLNILFRLIFGVFTLGIFGSLFMGG